MFKTEVLVRGWWRYTLAESHARAWPKLVPTDELYQRFLMWGEWEGFFNKDNAPSRRKFSHWMFSITGAKRAQKTVDGKRVRAARFDTISKHKEMFIHG